MDVEDLESCFRLMQAELETICFVNPNCVVSYRDEIVFRFVQSRRKQL